MEHIDEKIDKEAIEILHDCGYYTIRNRAKNGYLVVRDGRSGTFVEHLRSLVEVFKAHEDDDCFRNISHLIAIANGYYFDIPKGSVWDKKFETSVGETIDRYNKVREMSIEAYYTKTEKGRAQRKAELERELKRKKYEEKRKKEIFQSQEEAEKALTILSMSTEHCDLMSEHTSLEDAMAFCTKIMKFLSNCSKYSPDQERLKSVLKKLGACTLDEAHEKFKPIGEGLCCGEKNNIEYPLIVFDSIFLYDMNRMASNFGFHVLNGMCSPINEWLEVQERSSQIEAQSGLC